MGLPRDLRATVIAIERCPEINDGAGRVVLTTINHLNRFVFELTIKDGTGHSETVRTTGFHKFYSDSRNDWISAAELRKGEQLRGVNGALTVAGLASLPGVHRVYNMTVEDEHVYRVGRLGTLVHNAGCFNQNQQALIDLAKGAKQAGRTNPIGTGEGETLVEWGDEYGVPSHGPEVHPNRPFNVPHVHVGPVDHIPVQ